MPKKTRTHSERLHALGKTPRRIAARELVDELGDILEGLDQLEDIEFDAMDNLVDAMKFLAEHGLVSNNLAWDLGDAVTGLRTMVEAIDLDNLREVGDNFLEFETAVESWEDAERSEAAEAREEVAGAADNLSSSLAALERLSADEEAA